MDLVEANFLSLSLCFIRSSKFTELKKKIVRRS